MTAPATTSRPGAVTDPTWLHTTPTDPRGRALADRHYPRRRPGTPRFVAPGSPLVLITPTGDAVWVTLKQKHVRHRWPGAWSCPLFRNESPRRSSELIREAVAFTTATWGELPEPHGLITFVDPEKTRARRSRRARPGECFRRAGFEEIARTPAGHGRPSLVVLQLRRSP